MQGAIISKRTLLHPIDPAKSTRGGAERGESTSSSSVTLQLQLEEVAATPAATAGCGSRRWGGWAVQRAWVTGAIECSAVASWLPARRGYKCGWDSPRMLRPLVMCELWSVVQWLVAGKIQSQFYHCLKLLGMTGIFKNGLSEAKRLSL
jgi:hypothetical protein